jgi:hypothetical protein
VGHADDVSDALMGVSTGLPDDRQDAVETMERPAEVLADALWWSLGVAGTFGWHEELRRGKPR